VRTTSKIQVQGRALCQCGLELPEGSKDSKTRSMFQVRQGKVSWASSDESGSARLRLVNFLVEKRVKQPNEAIGEGLAVLL